MCQKRCEIIAPFIANTDPTAAIVSETYGIRVVATIHCVLPCSVF